MFIKPRIYTDLTKFIEGSLKSKFTFIILVFITFYKDPLWIE